MGKCEAGKVSDVLSEDEKVQLENGLGILVKIFARAYLKEKSVIMQELNEKYSESALASTGIRTMAEQQSGKPLTMTVREAAELLGISKKATYEAIHTGRISHIKMGRRIIIPRTRLMELLLEKGPEKPMR